jgi:hypothetical protein
MNLVDVRDESLIAVISGCDQVSVGVLGQLLARPGVPGEALESLLEIGENLARGNLVLPFPSGLE